LGWKEEGQWEWTHEATGASIDFSVQGLQEKDKIAHDVRESWRERTWRKFLKAPKNPDKQRNDARDIQGTDYSIERLKKTRKAASRKPELAYFYVGSWPSPGKLRALLEMQGKEQAKCIWGCGQATVGTDHTLWECPERGVKLEKPQDKLTCRLCWSGGGELKDEDLEELVTQVVSKSWQNRKGETSRRCPGATGTSCSTDRWGTS